MKHNPKHCNLGAKSRHWALAAAFLAAGLAASAAETGCHMLDLKPIVNMGWQDDEVWGDGKGGWTDQGDTDMRGIEVGMRTFFGIPFEVIDPAKNGGKAVLTLKSKKFAAGPVSATAERRRQGPQHLLPARLGLDRRAHGHVHRPLRRRHERRDSDPRQGRDLRLVGRQPTARSTAWRSSCRT